MPFVNNDCYVFKYYMFFLSDLLSLSVLAYRLQGNLSEMFISSCSVAAAERNSFSFRHVFNISKYIVLGISA